MSGGFGLAVLGGGSPQPITQHTASNTILVRMAPDPITVGIAANVIVCLAMRWIGLVFVAAACGGATAEAPLTIELGITHAAAEQALHAHQFCRESGLVDANQELFPRCERTAAEVSDAWVTAIFDGDKLVELRRWERFGDDNRAIERWNELVIRAREDQHAGRRRAGAHAAPTGHALRQSVSRRRRCRDRRVSAQADATRTGQRAREDQLREAVTPKRRNGPEAVRDEDSAS